MFFLVQYALSFVGTPYKWNGNNPIEGFDCSGLAMEHLRAHGAAPKGDHNSQMLFNYFSEAGRGEFNSYKPGALVFYGQSASKITHIAIMIDEHHVLEAAGGDHTTLTLKDAAAKNAFVRVRPFRDRKDVISVIRPYYRNVGVI